MSPGCFVLGFLFSDLFPCLDIRCFERSLVGHRDAGFFTFGQLNNFVRKLCYRSLLPKHHPKNTDWTQLPILRSAELRQLSTRDFLHRLKLKEDLDGAASSKIKRDYSDKEGPIPNFSKLVEECKEKFAGKARGYLVYLGSWITTALTLIVKGMASFDPHILLSLPRDQATHCYRALYNSFNLRGWLEGSSDDDCPDEYLEFVDQFREKYAAL